MAGRDLIHDLRVRLMQRCVIFLLGLGIGAGCWAAAAGEPDFAAAARYLDERAEAWQAFDEAQRGRGETRTVCISCHTSLMAALAQPALARLTTHEPPAALRQMRQHLEQRAAHWADLASDDWQLAYAFDEEKQRQSRGTEAVLSAYLLAADDCRQERTEPSPATQTALANLWATQRTEGPAAGSWEWMNFDLEPWEGRRGGYFGAALAALAVGTAPGYFDPQQPSPPQQALQNYLRQNIAGQTLHDQAWLLLAAAALPGTIDIAARDKVVAALHQRQRDDGGWRLPDLGPYQRGDQSPAPADSDGYATGLVVWALRQSGLSTEEPVVRDGRDWLRRSQRANGSWPGHSVNVTRDETTHVGQFMSDAATAVALQALAD